MAVNQSRDMHSELIEGATDGSVMKLGGGMRGGQPDSLQHDTEKLSWPHWQQVERHRPDLSHIG